MLESQRPEAETVEAEVQVIRPSANAESETTAAAKPRFGEALRRWFSRGSTDAQELAGAVREEAAIANEQVQAYVRKEPVKAVLMAAAAGAVVTVRISAIVDADFSVIADGVSA